MYATNCGCLPSLEGNCSIPFYLFPPTQFFPCSSRLILGYCQFACHFLDPDVCDSPLRVDGTFFIPQPRQLFDSSFASLLFLSQSFIKLALILAKSFLFCSSFKKPSLEFAFG